jgi:hypothetical protein
MLNGTSYKKRNIRYSTRGVQAKNAPRVEIKAADSRKHYNICSKVSTLQEIIILATPLATPLWQRKNNVYGKVLAHTSI